VTPSGQPAVWLDTPVIDILHGEGTAKKRIPAMFRQYFRFGIDLSKEPILTYPTQHYQNGGLKIDVTCETPVRNLYAAGEVAGGMHGRNRLMGNSLLDVVVFGRRAGDAAAKRAASIKKQQRLTLEHLERYHAELEGAGVPRDRRAPMLLPEYRRTEHAKRKVSVLA
jgi:succinate dehydrogenase / fumarate reductase flavoprotein subunit